MKAFAALYLALDGSTKTSSKLAALVAYFRSAPPADAAWAAWFLTGHRLKRILPVRTLVATALAESGVPEWLFDASYEAVGDLAETIALLLPAPATADDRSLADWIESSIAPLAGATPDAAAAALVASWRELGRDERFVHGKLITGAFRVGVARGLVHRALAEVADVPVATVAHNLAGPWTPSPAFWERVRDGGATGAPTRPYPFFLAHALEADPATLGARDEWQVEWKWDGIRAQVVRRGDAAALWSRGEEAIDDAFPDLAAAARSLPSGTVLDGEIVVWDAAAMRPQPFATLQRRLNRRAPGAKLLRELPIALIAYDLLEADGTDLRNEPLHARRARLARVLHDAASPALTLSPLPEAADWEAVAALRERSRDAHAEGLMLKRRDSAYGVGRPRGAWWKWKVDPYTVDAVLVYAQAGHGRRASLYTDFTFAVWDEGVLVPFAKAYSGLTDAEIVEADRWIRAHTTARFGPVRQVEPVLVFELAFEALARSPRHKSGVAVRFPRIARWRRDKPAAEADTLADLRARAEL
ncbi:MAG: ATP-dependent DNA ligase, partial [Proteobacteria bacterium]|nr:ATP-dependent DNA ligase [Pseudomonadota bacterium]